MYGGGKIANGTAPIVNRIDGGYLSTEPGTGTRGESNLDLCYAMGLTHPNNVTLYQVGDDVAWNKATNNNFLDAIDGAYCTTDGGDDPVWDAVYPHDDLGGTRPNTYTGPPMCGTYDATRVISVSYGSEEAARPAGYRARECAEYMKLGLMGVTVMFSSGDSGVAGLRSQCMFANNNTLYPPGSTQGRFNPSTYSSLTSFSRPSLRQRPSSVDGVASVPWRLPVGDIGRRHGSAGGQPRRRARGGVI